MKLVIRILFFPLIVFLAHCSGRCTYKVFAEFPNSNRQYRVVKFYNWCGATSSSNNNFSLLGAADSIENRKRIIFVVNSTVGENLERDSTVSVRWDSDSSILITYDQRLVVIQKESQLDNISIKYDLK